MTVFLVQHVHLLDEDSEDVKIIGVYSSREKASAAITRLSRAPGFCDSAEGFNIDEYDLDNDQWIEGYTTVATA